MRREDRPMKKKALIIGISLAIVVVISLITWKIIDITRERSAEKGIQSLNSSVHTTTGDSAEEKQFKRLLATANLERVIIASRYDERYEMYPGETFEVTAPSVKTYGDWLTLELDFKCLMDRDSVNRAVKITGTNFIGVGCFDYGNKTQAHYTMIKVKPGQSYQLIIGAMKTRNGSDSAGATINIQMADYPVATFSLLGADGMYTNLDTYNARNLWDVRDLHITDSPKTFNINFSKAVEQKSVEKAILAGLKPGEFAKTSPKCQFNWVSAQKLRLTMEGFEDGAPYKITFFGAKDSEGMQVVGELAFVPDKANSLGYIDILTGQNQVIKEFLDKRFMALKMPTVGRWVVLNNVEEQFIFDLEEKQSVRSFPLQEPRYARDTLAWYDGDNLYAKDVQNNNLVHYSLTDNKLSQITLSEEGEYFDKLCFAPDRERILLGSLGCLQMITSDGTPLTNYNVEHPHDWNFNDYLQFYDNKTAMFQEEGYIFDKKEKREVRTITIYTLDLVTGEKVEVANGYRDPQVLVGKDMFVAQSLKDKGNLTLFRGKEQILLPHGKVGITNFRFIDETQAVFNRGNDICLYRFTDHTEKVIGQGSIFGLSNDGSRVYYLTNEKDMYFD